MRLLRAELLKIRRRQATYVVLFVAVVLMVVIFLLTGSTLGGLRERSHSRPRTR